MNNIEFVEGLSNVATEVDIFEPFPFKVLETQLKMPKQKKVLYSSTPQLPVRIIVDKPAVCGVSEYDGLAKVKGVICIV